MELMDGSIAKNAITHSAPLTFRIRDQVFSEEFFVITAGSHPMALGLPWLKKHNPNIDWSAGIITELRAGPNRGKILARAGDTRAKKHVPIVSRYLQWSNHTERDPEFKDTTVVLGFNAGDGKSPFVIPIDDRLMDLDSVWPTKMPSEQLNKEYFLAGKDLTPEQLAEAKKRKDAYLQMSTLVATRTAVISRLTEMNTVTARNASVNGLTGNAENWLESIPPQFRHFAATVFSDESAKVLPPSRPGLDCAIDLKEGETLSTCKIYDMSKEQLDTLKAILDEQLGKGFIKPSSSSASSPVFFVKDKGSASRGVEQLRLVVDYRSLNAKIVMDEYPIPLTRTVMQQLARSKVFTKFDVRAGFNNIRIRPGDEWKTAFKTFFGLFEYQVMPFGLATAPSTFQRFINSVLSPFLDRTCFAYLDDIIIFSDSQEQHDKDVAEILRALQQAELHLKPVKCVWSVPEVSFLGFTAVAGKGLRMSDDKLQGLREWTKPTTVKQVRMFLGTVNFYHDFVPHYSDIVSPLTNLTKKDKNFEWTAECDNAWARLMALLRNDVFLAAFDPTLPTILETDASDVAYAGVISQLSHGKYRPVLMFSHKFQDAETRYSVAEKELFAIVHAIKRYPHFLHAKEPLRVYTDHRNLARFMHSTKLTSRLGRWYDDMVSSGIDFQIQYRPGMENTVADALSRYQKDASEGNDAYAPILPRHRFSDKALADIDLLTKPELSKSTSRRAVEISSRAGFASVDGRPPVLSCSHPKRFGMCTKCFENKSDPATRLASYGHTEAWTRLDSDPNVRRNGDRRCIGSTPTSKAVRKSSAAPRDMTPPPVGTTFFGPSGSHGFLSNMYPAPCHMAGHEYANVEQGFQHQKALLFHPESAADILAARTPHIAKKLGRLIPNFDSNRWSYVRNRVMTSLLRSKFATTKMHAALALTSGPITEANPHDEYWGIGTGDGRNRLGRLLTRIRNDKRIITEGDRVGIEI
jgi:ribA/ribD-fused uncharacterized protein